ncbi:MAG: hypothetical protein H3C43_00065 [Leptonema sp. (in: Bacteria)]|nr:hypothetical protein [Leptonema sp. (in: bacteria)]
MYHRDYTIRMLQQLIQFLAHLAGLVERDDPRIIAIELEAAFHRFLGMPRHLILQMDFHSLIQIFSVTGNLDADRTLVAGLLIKEESKQAIRIGSNAEATVLLKRANQLIDAAKLNGVSKELQSLLTDDT